MITTCRNPNCRKEFEAKRASARFCSVACRVAAHRVKAHAEDRPTVPQWCGDVPNMSAAHRALAEQAAAIVQGYDGRVTLRQTYYRLVAKNIIPNTEASYKRLGGILTNARKLGIIPWDAMEDRGRSIDSAATWNNLRDFRASMRHWYDEDRWTTQQGRVAVIVEKQALAGLIEPVCRRWQVPFIAAKGYASATLLAEASIKLYGHVVLYLGDHDPSGVDMSRDWQDRLSGFASGCHVSRIGLSRDQIDEFELPPQPVKTNDARAEGYRAAHGDGVWELDAMPPDALVDLVERHIKGFVDEGDWQRRDAEIEAVRARL